MAHRPAAWRVISKYKSETAIVIIAAVVFALVVKPKTDSLGKKALVSTASAGDPLRSDSIGNAAELAAVGRRTGGQNPRVQIVVFSDFQCPFCRRLDAAVDTLQTEFPEVGMVFRHFPLRGHPFAEAAAIASECAGDQEKFNSMRSMLFAHQSRIGKDPWSEYARRAGVPDLNRFAACLRTSAAKSPVDRDVAAGQSIPIEGTPEVIINGKRLSRPPSLAELRVLVLTERQQGAGLKK